MEYTSLPLDCQIYVLSCYPMYRTLCSAYNKHFLNIYYEKYAYLPILEKELQHYINISGVSEYTAVCYDCIIKTHIDHKTGIKSQSVKQIEIYPKRFEYLYTNKIKTKDISYDMYNNYNKYKCLDDDTTRGILLLRNSCMHPNYINNYIKRYSYFPQDNDLDTLLSIVRNQVIMSDANVNIKLSFLHKKIMVKYEKEYVDALDMLKL